jgi:lysophospholipase L1-like esterase
MENQDIDTTHQLEVPAAVSKNQSSRATRQTAAGVVKKVFFSAALLVISISIGLIIIEALFRIAGHRLQEDSTWSDRPSLYYKHEASPTLQDYPHSSPKAANTYRIGVLGDSFTFATQIQFDDAFPKKLERMLNLNKHARRVEVINYGVPGFSTYHEIETFRRASRQEADLIMLEVTLNDPQLKRYTPKGITGRNEYGEFNLNGRFKTLSSYWKSFGFVMNRLHNTKTHTRYINYYFSLFENQESWYKFEQALKKMALMSKRKKVELVAIVFPLFGLPLDNEYPFLPLHKKIGDLLENLDIEYLDLFPTFKGIPLERIQLIPGQDFHPNEIGHRLAAEAIYNWLIEEQLLPAEFAIKDQYKTRMDIRADYNQPLQTSLQ